MKPGGSGADQDPVRHHVIKVLRNLLPHIRSFDEVRGQILSELSETRSQAETDRLGRELADKIKRLKNPSDDELRKLQNEEVTYNETPWAAKGDPIAGIGANARFSDETWSLKLGQISTTPITTNRGPAFVKPTEERPAGLPPLEEIKAKVTTDFQGDKRDQEAIATPAVVRAPRVTLAAVAAVRNRSRDDSEFGPADRFPKWDRPELSAAVFKTEKGQTGPPSRCPEIRALPRRQPRQRRLEDVRDQKPEILETLQAREADACCRAGCSGCARTGRSRSTKKC
jgi:hypothetical protein